MSTRKECDNVKEVHNLVTVNDDSNAMRVFCVQCKYHYTIRKDENGNPEKRNYARLYKRDILQPHENLYYKVYPDRINIV